MGTPSCIESQHRRYAAPATPPDSASPRTSAQFFQSSDERDWRPSFPVSPPMSNYETSSAKGEMTAAGKSIEEVPAPAPPAAVPPVAPASAPAAITTTASAALPPPPLRRDPPPALPNLPRTQLPSLSSLFGPPSARPLHSPLSDRHSPFAATSPLDRPHGSAGLERSYSSSSYFPPTSSTAAASPASQPRSTVLEPRLNDRASLHSFSRTLPGAVSPRFPDAEQLRPKSHSESSCLGQSWASHHDPGRCDYPSSAPIRDAFRPSLDRFPPQLAGHKRPREIGPPYLEHQPGHSIVSALPPTPASTVVSDGIPLVTDGLGPKIWTGTHFLPRFLRAADVPGEGLCYFYDDGSHCKSVIDGEAVNAHWGVTKAGKPRKRLAIACVTCREKTIKCDPDYPRCVQCEKFGRICKFKNAYVILKNPSADGPSDRLQN